MKRETPMKAGTMDDIKSVRPRKPRTNADRPITAVLGDTYCNEGGETGSTTDLITLLRTLTPQILVTGGESVALLGEIEKRYGNGKSDRYQSRVTPFRREIFRPRARPNNKLYALHSMVKFFGWHDEPRGRGNTIRNRYHFIIDPTTFCEAGRPKRELSELIKWAQVIRDFCIEQQKDIYPTAGGIGRQFLVDPRFYPQARRKVPRATNDKARECLPGNHYHLAVEPGDTEYSGIYLDQTKSHHYHAQTARLPSSDTLYGYGSFRTVPTDAGGITESSRVDKFLEGFSGIVAGTLYWPVSKRKEDALVPGYLRSYTEQLRAGDRGFRKIWVEDIPLLAAIGVRVTSITAAWGSYDQDTGLAAYSRWAMDYMGKNPSKLLKAILLTPYGALATTPSTYESFYHQSKSKGPRTQLRTRSGVELWGKVHGTSKELEPGTNNVIHRGLIEASNRSEVLLYARHLEENEGRRVLCVYADGIILEGAEPPTYMPHPWRVQTRLTRLRFISSTQFTSDQMTKLPGVGKRVSPETREEQARKAAIGRYEFVRKQEHETTRLAFRQNRSAEAARVASIEEHDRRVLNGK